MSAVAAATVQRQRLCSISTDDRLQPILLCITDQCRSVDILFHCTVYCCHFRDASSRRAVTVTVWFYVSGVLANYRPVTYLDTNAFPRTSRWSFHTEIGSLSVIGLHSLMFHQLLTASRITNVQTLRINIAYAILLC